MERFRLVMRAPALALVLLLIPLALVACSPSAKDGATSPSPSTSSKDAGDGGGGSPSSDSSRPGDPLPEGDIQFGEGGKVQGNDKNLSEEQRAELKAASEWVIANSSYKDPDEFLLSGIHTATSGSETWMSASAIPMKGGEFVYIVMRESGGTWEGVTAGPKPQPEKAPADVRAKLFPAK